MSSMRPSVYEFAGGEAAFLALARAHHARCLADPELNHPFTRLGQHPQHVERLAAYWAQALGGPPRFTGEHGGTHADVVRMHCGNGDVGDLNSRFLACFVAAMDDAGLPDDPEFRAALRAYLEWSISQISGRADEADPQIADDAPMPSWTW